MGRAAYQSGAPLATPRPTAAPQSQATLGALRFRGTNPALRRYLHNNPTRL